MQITCCICTDNIGDANEATAAGSVVTNANADVRPCTIPCGHVFHFQCLSGWLGRQNNTCPRCRANCRTEQILKLFLIDESPPETARAVTTTRAHEESDQAVVRLTEQVSGLEDEVQQKNVLLIANEAKHTRLSQAIDKLERDLTEANTTGQSIGTENVRLKRDLTAANVKCQTVENQWRNEKLKLEARLQTLQATIDSFGSKHSRSPPEYVATSQRKPMDNLRLYAGFPDRSLADKSRSVDVCPRCRCWAPSRLWCPFHAVCTERCRSVIKNMTILRQMGNGEMFCGACVPFTCVKCKRQLSGSCVKNNGIVYHEQCFPCLDCELPLGHTATMLQKKPNRFHSQCLKCNRCAVPLVEKTAKFRGFEAFCTSCHFNI